MITEINLKFDEVIFCLDGDMGKKLLCNLKDLEACYNDFDDRSEVRIRQFWNGELKRSNRKNVKAMLKSMNLNNKFL